MMQVYFIRPKGQAGPVKVGYTSLIRDRIAGLNLWSPYELEIAATIDGDRTLERKFHALFEDDRQRGEWFKWSERLETVIAAINAGTFDVSTLPAPIILQRPKPAPAPTKEREARIQQPGLLNDIYAFCDQHGIAVSMFGRAAANDPALAQGLKQGRAPRAKTVARIRQFMAAYTPATSPRRDRGDAR